MTLDDRMEYLALPGLCVSTNVTPCIPISLSNTQCLSYVDLIHVSVTYKATQNQYFLTIF